MAPRSLARAEITFRCPRCGKEATAGIDGHGRCRSCGEETTLPVADELRESCVVDACPACGSSLLYVQRDFNQKVGLGVVALGAVLAPFTPYYSSLMVAALIDALLYALLPEITVCYRCHAHFRGFARNPHHQAFDLHVAEQYDVHPPSEG
jgi:DNA-directed RNA polymerase subunit RPC12/RpoP